MNAPSASPIRFLHVSDLRFEEPLSIDEEMPGVLRTELLQAKQIVLRKIASLAAERRVDFVLLTGRILSPSKVSPAVLRAFCSELRGLGEEGIPVYWTLAGGRKRWPEWIELPPCCYLVDGPTVVRNGQGVALLALVPFRHWMRKVRARREANADPGHLRARKLPVVVLADRVEKAKLQKAMEACPAWYWALCGGNRRQLAHAGQIAHAPGPTQPEKESCYGAHGCTEVHISNQGPPKIHWVPVDVARFVRIHLRYDHFPSREKLQEDAARQRDRIRRAWPDHTVLATWVIHLVVDSTGTGNVVKDGEGPLAEDFRRQCNLRYGSERPPFWSMTVRICPHIQGEGVFPRSFLSTFFGEVGDRDLLTEAISETKQRVEDVWAKEPLIRQAFTHFLRTMRKKKLVRLAGWEGLQQLAKRGATS
jgi:hypothetical protein